MLADNLTVSCTRCIYVGEYDQAIAFSEEALQIGQSSNNLWSQSHSLYNIGNVYWERGQVDQATAVMEDSLRLSELAGFMVAQAGTRADLAAVYGDLGAIELGLETARLALTVAETHV
jgi:tetratricopeptide (TPR) repeat protein